MKIFLFIFSLLYVMRHIFFFIKDLLKPIPEKYKIGRFDLITLGLTISYIITFFFI